MLGYHSSGVTVHTGGAGRGYLYTIGGHGTHAIGGHGTHGRGMPLAWRGKAARTRTRALFPMVAVIWFRIAASINRLSGGGCGEGPTLPTASRQGGRLAVGREGSEMEERERAVKE